MNIRPVAVTPLERVLGGGLRDVEVCGAGLRARQVGEENGARQVRVVGGVAGGPGEGAAADDGAQPVGVVLDYLGPGGEFEGCAEGVAGVDA